MRWETVGADCGIRSGSRWISGAFAHSVQKVRAIQDGASWGGGQSYSRAGVAGTRIANAHGMVNVIVETTDAEEQARLEVRLEPQ